ncbi:MAG: hypothetical protein KGM24_00065, partial [Elusimicrobia bacterium]|nr:hypothetical protein [Elusimicrobiota bacterium]
MGAPRPHEALDVLRALEDLASADPLNVRGVLATLLTLDGAPHARSGGMALLCDDEASGAGGARPFSTLPEALSAAAEKALSSQVPVLAELALDEDEVLFGPGGLSGRAEVWLEPVTGDLRESLRAARETLLRGEGLVVELSLSGEEAGRRRQLPPDHPAAKACYGEGEPELDEESERGGVRRLFRLPLIPMGK